jgi:hypothetical protein
MWKGVKRFFAWVGLLDAPTLIDQFQSIAESDVLELTDDMRLRPDPFGRFKRKLHAAKG